MTQKNPQMGIVWNEIRVLASRIGSARSILLHLVLLLAFGIWLPRTKGLDFLDTQILGAYACLGLLFAAPATAQAFHDAPSFQRAVGRIVAGVLYGEVVSAALLGCGILTVYLLLRGGYFPQPDWETLARCAIFGLAASLMLASFAALMTVRFSRTVATICLRIVFFGLLVVFFYWGRWLPDVGLTGGAICVAVAAVLLALLRRRLLGAD